MEKENIGADKNATRKPMSGRKIGFIILGIFLFLNMHWLIGIFEYVVLDTPMRPPWGLLGIIFSEKKTDYGDTFLRDFQQSKTYLYENDDFGFQFSYPAHSNNLTLIKLDGLSGVSLVDDKNPFSVFLIRFSSYADDQTAEQIINREITQMEEYRSPSSSASYENKKIDAEENIEVSGIPGKKTLLSYDLVREDGVKFSYKDLRVLVAKEGRMYSFKFSDTAENFKTNLALAEEILSSWKIGPSLIKNEGYKTYISELYGFKLSVPLSWYHCCSAPDKNIITGFSSSIDFVNDIHEDEVSVKVAYGSDNLQKEVAGGIEKLKAYNSNFVLESDQSADVGGRPARKLEYEFTEGGKTIKHTEVIAIVRGVKYSLLYKTKNEKRDSLVDSLIIPSFKIIERTSTE